MLEITTLSDSDLPFAFEMITREDWGNPVDDIKRVASFEPGGYFIGWINGLRAGMISSTAYDDYGFLGSLIVSAEFRGKGTGESLMKHAMAYLQDKGVKTIELDGVFPAVSLYRRLGFHDKYLSLRLKRPPDNGTDKSEKAQPIPEKDIISFDKEMLGINRKRMLLRFFEDFSDTILVDQSEDIKAYAVLKPILNNVLTIGPLVAKDSKNAEFLLKKIIRYYSNYLLAAGVPEINHKAVSLYLESGFIYSQPSLRMYLGERRDYEKHVYGIMSPEKG